MKSAGHRDVPARPTLWATTPGYLAQFGLKDTSEQPKRSELVWNGEYRFWKKALGKKCHPHPMLWRTLKVARMRTLVGMALGFVLFLACDHGLFSNDIYGRWADPFSTAGMLIAKLDSFEHMRASRNGIVVLGDSGVGEGFSVAEADDVATRLGTPASFGEIAVPGTKPRIWFYLLRQSALQRHHARLVVIMLTSYHDNDAEDFADRRYDLAFLHPLLGPMRSISITRD